MVALVFSFFIFVASQSQAFTLITTNPNQQGWASNEINLLVNSSNCPIDVVSLVNEAAAIWNDVANSNIKVSYGGTTTSTAYANPPTVYCETNFNAVTGASADYVPGAASVHTSNGTIYEGIMYLNASSGNANIQKYDRTLLTIIVAHEIGHLLGLGHSSDSNALMYYDGSYRTVLSLSQDDIDGVSYLYPSNELGKDKIMGCASVSRNAPPPPPKYLYALACLMLLPVVIALRLRQRKPFKQSFTS